MKSRLYGWFWRQVPKREELTDHRLIGPLARRQELWRFTRRSVPRGVAIGLLVGIFALIPGVQIAGADAADALAVAIADAHLGGKA